MFRFLKEYFSLSNNEQRGIIGLLLMILFVFGGSRAYLMWQKPKTIPQDNTQLLALFDENEESTEEVSTTTKEAIVKKIDYFSFNPNTVSKEELLALGFKENVANTLLNFRSKGGKFYQKDDLKKVYGLDENFYTQIADYIVIPSKEYPKKELVYPSAQTPKESSKTVAQAVMIELNSADSASLTSIKGIGPAFSSRILKYRNLLGGFRNKNQLLEVYGITPEVFEGIKDQIYVAGPVTQISVNQASWYDLKNHPYINSELANILLNYKKAHGKIENFDFLLESQLVSKEEYDKITPYLSVAQ